jgi:hypothetical protein
VLTAPVPGLKAEDIKIQVLEDVLQIEGEFPTDERVPLTRCTAVPAIDPTARPSEADKSRRSPKDPEPAPSEGRDISPQDDQDLRQLIQSSPSHAGISPQCCFNRRSFLRRGQIAAAPGVIIRRIPEAGESPCALGSPSF